MGVFNNTGLFGVIVIYNCVVNTVIIGKLINAAAAKFKCTG